MQDTGIADEIAGLRAQIGAAEAEIARLKMSASARRTSGDAAYNEETELQDLIEAHEHMVTRLSRLESCKRTPEG